MPTVKGDRWTYLGAQSTEQAPTQVYSRPLDLAEFWILNLLQPHAVVGAYRHAVSAPDALLEVKYMFAPVYLGEVELLLWVQNGVGLADYESPDYLLAGSLHRLHDESKRLWKPSLAHQIQPPDFNAAAINRFNTARGRSLFHPNPSI